MSDTTMDRTATARTPARAVADGLTSSMEAGDLSAAASCYGPDAVLITPEGIHRGREQITACLAGWLEPFTDLAFQVVNRAEWANQAFDEWVLTCTHSGDLPLPTGETVPASGRRITLRGADVCTVEDGVVTEHHVYYDQVELLGQLEVTP